VSLSWTFISTTTAWCFLFILMYLVVVRCFFSTYNGLDGTQYKMGWDYSLAFYRLHKHGSYTRRLYKDCTIEVSFLIAPA
jgi:hypothetical protein